MRNILILLLILSLAVSVNAEWKFWKKESIPEETVLQWVIGKLKFWEEKSVEQTVNGKFINFLYKLKFWEKEREQEAEENSKFYWSVIPLVLISTLGIYCGINALCANNSPSKPISNMEEDTGFFAQIENPSETVKEAITLLDSTLNRQFTRCGLADEQLAMGTAACSLAEFLANLDNYINTRYKTLGYVITESEVIDHLTYLAREGYMNNSGIADELRALLKAESIRRVTQVQVDVMVETVFANSEMWDAFISYLIHHYAGRNIIRDGSASKFFTSGMIRVAEGKLFYDFEKMFGQRPKRLDDPNKNDDTILWLGGYLFKDQTNNVHVKDQLYKAYVRLVCNRNRYHLNSSDDKVGLDFPEYVERRIIREKALPEEMAVIWAQGVQRNVRHKLLDIDYDHEADICYSIDQNYTIKEGKRVPIRTKEDIKRDLLSECAISYGRTAPLYLDGTIQPLIVKINNGTATDSELLFILRSYGQA